MMKKEEHKIKTESCSYFSDDLENKQHKTMNITMMGKYLIIVK